MTAANESPTRELLDYDDSIQPVIVTISYEDEQPDDEGRVHIGFRIRQWGSYFHIEPKLCWMERSGRRFEVTEMEPQNMVRARTTACCAVADMLSDARQRDKRFIVWN